MKLIKLFLLAGLIFMPTWSSAKLNVVTTTEDIASLTQEVGKDLINVETLSRGYMDPHFVEAKPSLLLKLRKADLFIEVGLELEVGWAPTLLTSARNDKILPGNPGYLEVAAYCDILQRPTGRVDRSMGDVHPLGNPHFWLDPNNGLAIASAIKDKLSELDSLHAAAYQANYDDFVKRLKAKDAEWLKKMSGLHNLRVVTYHNSWPNFVKHFGIEVVNYVEPKPGIPPSPAHIEELIKQMRNEHIPLILVEPYFDSKLPEKIAKDTGAKMIIFAPSVGAEESIKTYTDLFDHDIQLLVEAMTKTEAK